MDTTMVPAQAERRARMMRRINVPMRAILSLPFATPLSGRLMLVSYTGRRTGRAYRQPVSYVRDGDTVLTPGGGKWKLSLRSGESVRLHLRGRDVVARPESVRDFDHVQRLLGVMLASNPRLGSFVPFVEQDGTIEPGKLQMALDHGFCIVRWHFDRSRP